jgi:hypothetical protein
MEITKWSRDVEIFGVSVGTGRIDDPLELHPEFSIMLSLDGEQLLFQFAEATYSVAIAEIAGIVFRFREEHANEQGQSFASVRSIKSLEDVEQEPGSSDEKSDAA